MAAGVKEIFFADGKFVMRNLSRSDTRKLERLHKSYSAEAGAAGIPLILTFSRGEKEPLWAPVKNASVHRVKSSLVWVTAGSVAPSPLGEGRGEGKGDTAALRYVYYGNALARHFVSG